MKNLKPVHLLILSSGIVASFVCVFLIIYSFFSGQKLSNYFIIGLPIIIYGVIYFVFHYVLKNFIYQKIRLVYKSIYELKSPKNYTDKIQLQNDVIGDVEKEVNQWATNKQKEIQKLKKTETYRREFLGNVSHELKTPLYNIQGYLETLIDGGVFDDNINVKYLKSAFSNTNRLSDIISDLELISSIESDALSLDIKPFDIISLIKEVFSESELLASQLNISLIINASHDKSCMVLADKNRIHQVVTNLINNSIKYSKTSGSTTVSCYLMDENILVEITDDGIGIGKEHLPRLFERFYRIDTNRSREQGGTGLGLAIVKHIIEAHNQTINVRSSIGIGSTFGFTLKKG